MKTNLLKYLASAAATIACALSVQAVPQIYITDGTDTVTLNGTGNTVGGSGLTVGSWSITSVGGVSSGSVSNPSLDLSSLTVSGSGTLHIFLSDFNFGPSSGAVAMSLTGNAMSQITAALYAGAAGTYRDLATLIGSIGPVSGIGLSQQLIGSINEAGNYSLTAEITISANGVVTDSLDFNSHVPDGGTTVLLLGSALSGLALLRRRLA